jgi:hypothetical protein
MVYTPFTSSNQSLSRKRPIKKITRLSPWLNLTSLRKTDPYLISIASLASRLIHQVDDAFTSICNAPSNDGSEVTVLQWFPCARDCRERFTGERVEIDGAYNILVMHTYDRLQKLIRTWWYKQFRIFIFGPDFDNGKEKIEPTAPIEIKDALRTLALPNERRKPLIDMLALSQNHKLRLTCSMLVAAY